MKKVLAIALVLAMALTAVACGAQNTAEVAQAVHQAANEVASAAENVANAQQTAEPAPEEEKIKVGFIHVSDPSDMGYTYNHDLGTQHMAANLGLDVGTDIINKFNTPEDDSAVEAACLELIEEGCSIIFGTSFGFENAMLKVAKDHPEVEFCHATGFQAAGSGLANFHNYFGSIHQARYLSGIVAGYKSLEIKNNQLGYVAAVPFAEVISGFTAFYLGAKSVNPDATMKVMYTGSWNDPTKEAQNAAALIAAGCGVISQHCDSTAPATEAEKVEGVFHVGYNSDMTSVAPTSSLCSVVWDWGQYLTYAVTCVQEDKAIDVDWAGGLADGVCSLSPYNESIMPADAAAAVEKAKADLIAGNLYVFAGPLKGEGVDFSGNKVEIDLKEGEKFIECEVASAPAWNYIVEGVTVVE